MLAQNRVDGVDTSLPELVKDLENVRFTLAVLGEHCSILNQCGDQDKIKAMAEEVGKLYYRYERLQRLQENPSW